MLRFAIFLACITAAFGSSPLAFLEDRIVGGSTAATGQFPYQVSLRLTRSRSHSCGGSIISNRFILTAAHCVVGQTLDGIYAVVGTNSLSSGGVSYTFSNGAYHGNYDPNNILNDIAILKTSTNIAFNNYVQAIQLQTGEVPAGSAMILSGWGLTSSPGNIPDRLQYANLNAISQSQCAQRLSPSKITNDQICTFTRAGQGACNGDSGGPLVYGGKVSGIVSWGRPCALGYPDVFTKVSAYYSWIQSAMASM